MSETPQAIVEAPTTIAGNRPTLPLEQRSPAQQTKTRKPRKLSLKQQKFIKGYIETGNGSEAVRQAGYNTTDVDTICSIASENLRKPEIQKELARKTGHILSVDEILIGISEKTNSSSEMVSLKAFELLGRTQALFIDKSLNFNQNDNRPSSDLSQVSNETLESEMLKRIKLSSLGQDITPEVVETHSKSVGETH